MVKMYLPAACASCIMSTVGKSNHSASGTIHPLVDNVGSLSDGCVEVDVVLQQMAEWILQDVGWSEGVMDAEESGKFMEKVNCVLQCGLTVMPIRRL